jgi:hypothetical protein
MAFPMIGSCIATGYPQPLPCNASGRLLYLRLLFGLFKSFCYICVALLDVAAFRVVICARGLIAPTLLLQ